MSKVIKLRRGLDIRLVGEAEKVVSISPPAPKYALRPTDFHGVVPKLLVREGDAVKRGTPVFFDKNRPLVMFCSPVSGRIAAIIRGEKRRIEAVIIDSDGSDAAEDYGVHDIGSLNRESIKELLLKSGMWPLIMQRPYGVVADPYSVPRDVFVSGFDSSPLAPDTDVIVGGERENLQAGFDALRLLTDGGVYLGLRGGYTGILTHIKGVEVRVFEGPHPAGNVGVQINHTKPIRKGDLVWTAEIQSVALIGRFLLTGRVDMRKVVALTGSAVEAPKYFRVIAGMELGRLTHGRIKRGCEGNYRIISGNVLTGTKEPEGGFLGYYDNQVTVIPEGNHYELLGWLMPRTKKFSVSRSYFSWLAPKRKYNIDTNLHGGPRAFVTTDLYERYFPMDIYAMYLIKACLAGDIDKMENLGIYEVLPEDFALCEFVDPSKTNIQDIVQKGIDLMIKETN